MSTLEESLAKRGAEAGRLATLLTKETEKPIETHSDLHLYGPNTGDETPIEYDFVEKLRLKGPLTIRISQIPEYTNRYHISNGQSSIVLEARADEFMMQQNPDKINPGPIAYVNLSNFPGQQVRIRPYQ